MKTESIIRKFDKQANKYSKRRNNDYASKFRKSIFQEAEGNVLEVGIGAGLNFPFYHKNVTLTGVDFSHAMLNIAKEAAKRYPFQTTLIEADVDTVEFNDNIFDTIVSSGSLCAYQNPVHTLGNFRRWCKPGGKILLLEHGLSSRRSIACLQKIMNPLALRLVGCHQDRNITEMVKESQIKILKIERHLAGYLYVIWAEP